MHLLQIYILGCVGADGHPPLRNIGRLRSVEVTGPGKSPGIFDRPLPGINRTHLFAVSPDAVESEQPEGLTLRCVVEGHPSTAGLT